jgi:hypothetical protein
MKIEIEWGTFFTDSDVEGLEFLTIDPVSAFKYYQDQKSSLIKRCPAHTDILKNTYVLLCPIDLKVEINKTEKWANVIIPKNLPKSCFQPRFDEHNDSPYPVFSFAFPYMMFISKKHNVVMELTQPYLEWDRKQDIRIINGKFNIKRWHRPIQFAFEQKEKNVVVEFKRGESVAYVNFITENSDDIIVLKKVEFDKNQISFTTKLLQVTKFYNYAKLGFLYDLADKYKVFIEKFNK